MQSNTSAYTGFDNPLLDEETRRNQRKLKRLTEGFYYEAHRIWKLGLRIPGLNSWKCPSVTMVRNELIEHPEGGKSGVTAESFSYSRIEGPFVRGARIDGQLQHSDRGFAANSREFVETFGLAMEAGHTRLSSGIISNGRRR